MMCIYLYFRRLRTIGLLPFFLFCWCWTSFAQKQIACFTPEQLDEIYKSNFLDINLLMDKERWNLTQSQEDALFEKDGESFEYGLITWKNPLSFDTSVVFRFYHKTDFPNIIELKVNENCFNSIQAAVNKKYKGTHILRTETQYKRTIYGKHEQEEFSIVFSEALDGSAYWILYCPAEIDSIISEIKEEKERLRAEYEAKKKTIEDALFSSDSLKILGKLDLALSILEPLQDSFEEYNELIYIKIERLKADIKTQNINRLIEEGETLYGLQKWEDAEKKFNELMELDPGNTTAIKYLELIAKKYEIIETRDKIIYDYQKTNSESYTSFLNRLEKWFNQVVTDNAKGKYNISLTIHFDTLGVNQSAYALKDSRSNVQKNAAADMDSSFTQLLDSLFQGNILTPSSMEGILVNAKKEGNYYLEWNICRKRLIMKDIDTKIKPQSKFIDKDMAVVRHVTGNYPVCVGVYLFSVKNKTINGNSYADIKLDKFRTVGPEAMAYSLLCPGAGTLAATRGDKGWGTTIGFTLLGVASIVCHNEFAIKKDIPNANYITIGLGVAAGIVHVTDMFIALYKGCQNLKKSKMVREALKNGSIEILQENIVIPQN
ncbi:MAG: hypothetical protein FWH36_07710 [Lentimicrobiaceae bacterium]|nr:hypothetical protein [Lentimicrobiaceae bacterium]